MPVDFFAVPCANPTGNCAAYAIPCLTKIPDAQFGITDDTGASQPAKVDTVNKAIWDLEVINKSGIEVCFKAIDWCVPIYRTGTYNLDDASRIAGQFSSNNTGSIQLIKRCEGLLLYDSKILFIEIKRRRNKASDWIEDARCKFEETILSFKEHHPNLVSQIIKPVLVNPLHVGLAGSEMVQKRILKDKVGIEFIRQNSITI